MKKKLGPQRASSNDLTVGEVATRSGVAISAIHFYESKGLIVSRRATGRRRRYSEEVLQRVVMIKVAQRVGTPLRVIHDLLQYLPTDRAPTAQDRMALLAHWSVDIEQRLAQLARLREELDYCIGCACLSFERCPLIAPADW